MHDVRRAGLRTREKTLVVGGGPVGLLIAAVAADTGGDVLVVEPKPHRRRVAEGLGLTAVDPVTADAEQDRALTARGRLVLVAIHTVRRPLDLRRFFWRELTLVGARLYTRDDFERAVELVASRRIPLAALISRVVPLHQVGEAFAALEAGDAVMKVLIDCQQPRSGVGTRIDADGDAGTRAGRHQPQTIDIRRHTTYVI